MLRRLAFLTVATVVAHLLSTPAHAGDVTYIYTDPQGTPLVEADANGNITATFDYRPFGAQALGLTKSGPGYTGHVSDPDSGLVYMQTRYYDPAIGRFMSIDPVSFTGAGNFNRYAYVENNPIIMVDPDGRAAKLAKLIRLLGSGMRSIARVSREDAILAKKGGRDVQAATRQQAHQIANAASDGRGVVKDAGHELEDGSRGLPHYHTLDAKGKREPGHVFWGKMSIILFATADAVDKVANAAEYIPDPIPRPAEQDDVDRSNNIIDYINKLTGSHITHFPPVTDNPIFPPPEPKKPNKEPSNSNGKQ